MNRAEAVMKRNRNPILKADYPNPDVIRVGDVYYMLTSTLHFLPGALILRSYDLVNWEIGGYAFEKFMGTEEGRMNNERTCYGCGMREGSLRYHKGWFYVCFAVEEAGKTYFYRAEDVEGPWEGRCVDACFPGCSLFFDGDDRIFLAYGREERRMVELLPDLSGPAQGGRERPVPAGGDAPAFRGGPVENGDGNWFAVTTQDGGAAGRMPALVPVCREGAPAVQDAGGEVRVPSYVETVSTRPGYRYEPLYAGDDFSYRERGEGGWKLKPQWQWNHEPDPALWEIQRGGGLCITTGKLCTNVTQAVNTLTQRMFAPGSTVEVTVDASDLNEGDYAGICALQGCYGMIAVTRELRRYYLVVIEREDTEKNRNTASADYMPGILTEKVNLTEPAVRLRMEVDFRDGADKVTFSYREPREGGKWRRAGGEHRLYFGRDHLAGCRCGLSIFATKSVGGSALFLDFCYERTS